MTLIKTLKLMDEVISLIHVKDDSKSGLNSLHKFEFKLFLCLEIVRYQLQMRGEVSDKTANAISSLFVFGTFEYYYRDFPSVYEKCSELFNKLINYNEKLKNNTLSGEIGVKDEPWIKYFKETIGDMVMW